MATTITPHRPLICKPMAGIIPARMATFSGLSQHDPNNAIVEVEVLIGSQWRAGTVDKTTGEGSVLDADGNVLPVTIRNGENVTCRFRWQNGHLIGGTSLNESIAATVVLPVWEELV